jgi:F-type H+-transporting ATPase subunit b
MSLIAFLAAEDPSQTHSAIWPENYEMWFGIPASIIIFAALYKFAWPMVVKGMAARTERIQAQIDASAAAKTDADLEASQIRQALGDLSGERSRLLAEADQQSEALLRDGAVRLEAEATELEAKADADIAALATRGSDELRSEIARLSAAAAEHVVHGQLQDDVQQELIEAFIQKVGASR